MELENKSYKKEDVMRFWLPVHLHEQREPVNPHQRSLS